MLLQIPSSSSDSPYMTGKDLEYLMHHDGDFKILVESVLKDIDLLTALTTIDIDLHQEAFAGEVQVLYRTLSHQSPGMKNEEKSRRAVLEIVEALRKISENRPLEGGLGSQHFYCEEVSKLLKELQKAGKKLDININDAITDTRRTVLEIVDVLTPHARVVRKNFPGIAKRSYDELHITLKRFKTWKSDQIQSLLQAINTQRDENTIGRVFWVLGTLVSRFQELKNENKESISLDERNISFFYEIFSYLPRGDKKNTLIGDFEKLIGASSVQLREKIRPNYKKLGFVARNIDELFLSIDDYASWDGGQIFLFLLSLTNVEGEAEQVHQTLKKFLEKGFSFDDHHIQVILEIIQKRIFDDAHKRELIDIAKRLNRI